MRWPAVSGFAVEATEKTTASAGWPAIGLPAATNLFMCVFLGW